MTIVSILDSVAAWLERNICADVKLKPHSFDEPDDDYHELVHPAVFALYVPTHKTKPPEIKATTPAICVQLVDGTDEVFLRKRTVKLRLSFSAWDPGIHEQDVFTPTDGPSDVGPPYERGAKVDPNPFEHSKPKPKLTLTHTGWRDVWNFVDLALRVIETSRTVGGYPLNPKEAIKFGVYDEDGAIADYYPFWFAWAELALDQEVIVSDPAIGDLL